jgi:hypothetical protein
VGESVGEGVGASVRARPLDWPSSASEDGMIAVPLGAKGDVEGGVERDAANRLPEGLGLMLQVDASASSTSAAKDFEGSAEGVVEKGLPERSELTSGVEASAASARSPVKGFGGSVEGDVINSDFPVDMGEDVEPKDVEPKGVEPNNFAGSTGGDVKPKDVEPKDVEPRDVEPRDVENSDSAASLGEAAENSNPVGSLGEDVEKRPSAQVALTLEIEASAAAA